MLVASPISASALAAQARRNPLPAVLSGLTHTRRQAATTASPDTLTARLAGQTPEQQLHTLTRLVSEATATVLAHPDPAALDPQRPFKDLGIDSLTILELRNTLTAHTGLTLPATLTFDHPTPAALAEHLATQLTSTITTAAPLGPVGRLVEAAFDNDQHATLIDILVAASRLDYPQLPHSASVGRLPETIIKAAANAPVRVVCLAEFSGQFHAFADGMLGDVEVAELIVPGFGGTPPAATAHHAAQTLLDCIHRGATDGQAIVLAAHAITCIPAMHVLALQDQIQSTTAPRSQCALVTIAPIATNDHPSISSNPMVIPAIMAHLHDESALVGYGRYLGFDTPTNRAIDEERLLTIQPRTGDHINTPTSPLTLEPAITAMTVSNWIADNYY
ncbi:Phenolphthiocerol synthesis polyketide synthase type I Pks15/1 [Mycobacterium simulans]|nr:Phenolphthiocerol synthesis polyketide synthase type I Pks15/1 [Mycobacterium simulans]